MKAIDLRCLIVFFAKSLVLVFDDRDAGQNEHDDAGGIAR